MSTADDVQLQYKSFSSNHTSENISENHLDRVLSDIGWIASDDSINTASDETFNIGSEAKTKKRNVWISLISIVMLLAAWITQCEILGTYSNPLFLRWCVNSGYIIAIVPWLFLYMTPFNNQPSHYECEQSGRNCKLFKKLILGGAKISIMSFLCGYVWYISLHSTQPAINSTIYQSQIVFVYILGIIFLQTTLTVQKTTAVILSLTGVALVSFGSKEENSTNQTNNTIAGLLLCLLSTFCYACWEVLAKYYSDAYFGRHKVIQDTFLLQTCIGLASLCLFWPLLIIWDQMEWEIFEFPSNDDWINISKIVALDFTLALSIILGQNYTSALIMAMAQLLGVPATFAIDIFIRGDSVTTKSVLGSVLIIVAFLLMEIPIYTPLKRLIKTRLLGYPPTNQSTQRPLLQNHKFIEIGTQTIVDLMASKPIKSVRHNSV